MNVDTLLTIAYQHVDNGRPIAATDTLVQQLDAWLSKGELDHVRNVLAKLEPKLLPPEVITGVLSLTWHAKERLGTARTMFFLRTMSALETVWKLPAEQLKSVADRLR